MQDRDSTGNDRGNNHATKFGTVTVPGETCIGSRVEVCERSGFAKIAVIHKTTTVGMRMGWDLPSPKNQYSRHGRLVGRERQRQCARRRLNCSIRQQKNNRWAQVLDANCIFYRFESQITGRNVTFYSCWCNKMSPSRQLSLECPCLASPVI